MKKVLSLCVICLMAMTAMAQTVWVDLDLPSGTKWKSVNENGYFSYEEAVDNFGAFLPTKEQFQELKACCIWEWKGDGYLVTGNNGNSIFLPAAGHRDGTYVFGVQVYGHYWSATVDDGGFANGLGFDSDEASMGLNYRGYGFSVRLVK